jgi:serine/threonine protein kinase
MCKAGSASSHRQRRVINPNVNATQPFVTDVTLPKHRGLHQDKSLRQITPASSDTSSRDYDHTKSIRDRTLYPITGRHSNVLDDYVIFPKVLGKGHYGVVRECVCRSTRQFYACKSIDKSKIRRLDHLQREVTLLSKINHRGIMKMMDCYEDGDFVHIVTEKCSGGELFDKIIENTTSTGCYSEKRAACIIKSLLKSVAYLHENDIVHRDIKPENILFVSSQNDSIKLIDFGLSRRHKPNEAPMSNPVGTAYYMSPELLKGNYSKSADIWSVGVVAYILLCGYPPFNGDTDPVIFDTIENGQLDFPSRAWSSKSSMARDFIQCLLRRDPSMRFTAKEALLHPWILNLTKRPETARRRSSRSSISSSVYSYEK